MDIQSALGECDIARAILIAMGAYKKTPSANESILQSLTFAVESSLDRAKGVFSYKKNNQIQSAPTPSPCPSVDASGMTIGARILNMRNLREMTSAELAKSVDVQPTLIAMWESGATEPRAKHIIPLANALKCDPMWLLTGNPNDVKTVQPAPQSAPAPVNVMKGADLANIGVRIESRRNYIEMSLNKLAEEIDTSGAMIREWETGKAIPHSDYIDKLAKALNTTVTWLMTGKAINDAGIK
ncbi:TPA: helix-turn-helix domain-containing protein [Salmonella enterica subsp. enterica serovar Birkenhead]